MAGDPAAFAPRQHAMTNSRSPIARSSLVRSVGLVLGLLAWCPWPAAARQEPVATSMGQQSVEAMLVELRNFVTDQRRIIDGQTKRIDALEQEVAALKQQQAGAQITPSVEQRLAQVERAMQRVPELPTPLISAGEFPGSLRIPGTDAAIKIGGQARMTLVQTLGPLGTDDRFVTSSIPVDVQTAGEDARTVYSPSASRFNIDLRAPFAHTQLLRHRQRGKPRYPAR
jgi:hypothetical protein